MEPVGTALKEWAVVEEAMSRGWISVLLRKGGIWEPREGFRVAHRTFWIFPGVYHQKAEELSEALAARLAGQLDGVEPDPVPLRLLARVEEVIRIDEMSAVDDLYGLHPLGREAARARFRYRGRPYVHALLLRVHALAQPVTLRNSLAYVGCRSWLELNAPISPGGAEAVLGEEEFAATRAELWKRLGGRGEPLEPASGTAP